MDPERWQKLKMIFNEALQQKGSEQYTYIEKACKEDTDLQKEVLSLLEAYATPGFLDQPPKELVTSALTYRTNEEQKGEQIGSYKIDNLLGHGGMGSVYLAHRTDGHFDQNVALKLLRTDFVSTNRTRRFLAERQILAILNHKYIARLYDGGVSDSGQPWFAMEYVEGCPINEYCNSHRLGINQRLELFINVCEAVQYAHRRLIVHRDIKPSNILVTDEGVTKLLDFGIATTLKQDEPLTGIAPLTRTGLLPLTPAYASPEQVRGEPITTASDIYQLGVMLYELLCGCLPYEISGETPSEVERIICEKQPAYPSTSATEKTNSRKTSPEQLQRQLRGDLDTVVMKALRKEPDRRYESVEQLATDIRNYLEGRPVTAHPDSLTYRTGKFFRRHVVGVASVLAIIVLLFGYALTITWHSQQTQAALKQSQQETEKAEQVTDFLISMFERANPYESEVYSVYNDTITTNELLNQGVMHVRRELADQPQVQAKIMYNLGQIYRLQGQYDKALPLLEDALMLQQKHPFSNDLHLADNLHELARLLRHQGELERPARLYREALRIQKRHYGDEHTEIAKNLQELGVIAARKGMLPRADSLFRVALEMHKSTYGPGHPEIATSLHLLGVLYIVKEEFLKAEQLLNQSLSIRQNHVDSDHPMLVETKDRLGQVLVRQGRIEEAEPLLREALNIREKLFRKEHPSRAVSLANVGRLLRKKGDYVEADKYLRRAQLIYQKLYGPNNLDAANTLLERARLYKVKGDYRMAKSLYRQAIKMQQSINGLDQKYSQRSLDELAEMDKNEKY